MAGTYENLGLPKGDAAPYLWTRHARTPSTKATFGNCHILFMTMVKLNFYGDWQYYKMLRFRQLYLKTTRLPACEHMMALLLSASAKS
jgi:hypothetical protein